MPTLSSLVFGKMSCNLYSSLFLGLSLFDCFVRPSGLSRHFIDRETRAKITGLKARRVAFWAIISGGIFAVKVRRFVKIFRAKRGATDPFIKT